MSIYTLKLETFYQKRPLIWSRFRGFDFTKQNFSVVFNSWCTRDVVIQIRNGSWVDTSWNQKISITDDPLYGLESRVLILPNKILIGWTKQLSKSDANIHIHSAMIKSAYSFRQKWSRYFESFYWSQLTHEYFQVIEYF